MPVRMAMEVGEEEDHQGSSRRFHDEREDLDWVVTVGGRSVGGVLPLRTVPLMELVFAKADEPDKPLRRAFRYDGSLAAVSDEQLMESFRASDPVRDLKSRLGGKNRREQNGPNPRRGGPESGG